MLSGGGNIRLQTTNERPTGKEQTAMSEITVHVEGLTDALDLGFSFRSFLDDTAAVLTDEHPSSSRGMPVLVKDGQAYGPADLQNVTIFLGNTEASGSAWIERARAAGWTVRVVDVTN
jgi:hypothetical protein